MSVVEKPFRELGFTHVETKEIVLNLNKLLANYQVYYQKLRNFHWNITGRDFFELHELFEEEYNRAHKEIDDIAERIRVFGKRPHGRMSDYLNHSDIKEPAESKNSEYMVKEILTDMEILLSFMVEAVDSAKANADMGTSYMLSKMILKLEKSHWMFTSWYNEKAMVTNQ